MLHLLMEWLLGSNLSHIKKTIWNFLTAIKKTVYNALHAVINFSALILLRHVMLIEQTASKQVSFRQRGNKMSRLQKSWELARHAKLIIVLVEEPTVTLASFSLALSLHRTSFEADSGFGLDKWNHFCVTGYPWKFYLDGKLADTQAYQEFGDLLLCH